MPVAVRIFRFYVDGFKSMTVGRKLWLIIAIKVAILFGVLRLFLFPDIVAERTPAGGDGSETVRSAIIGRDGTSTPHSIETNLNLNKNLKQNTKSN